MDTIFMNSESSEISELRVLILKLNDKLNLTRGKKMLLYQTLEFIIHGKTQKAYIITTSVKYQLKHGMINLNYHINHILCQIFKIILSIFFKKYNEKIGNPSMRIYINKTKNRITFKITTGYYLELLTLETMKLLGSTENRTNKEKNGENVLHFVITEVVLVYWNIANDGC